MDRNSWRTPGYIFEEANRYFNFDLDAAASGQNHLVKNYFTKENSALSKDWSGFHNVWCNPPYGRGLKEPFFEKAHKEIYNSVRTVFFVPALPSEMWFPWGSAKAVVFIRGRVNFLHPETGLKQNGVPSGSCYIIMAPKEEKDLTLVRSINRIDIENKDGTLANLFEDLMG